MKENTRVEFLYGGSFDPIHFGHINVIKNLRKLRLHWPIRILPCFIPPLKNLTTASFAQRVKMLRLATTGISYLQIDERESQRDRKSYTIDSLKSMAQEYPNRNFALVVGYDTLKGIKQWNQWKKLSDSCHLLIVNRPGVKIKKLDVLMNQAGFQPIDKIDEMERIQNGRYYSFNTEETDISSTEVRARILAGLSVDKLVPKNVLDYVEKEFIYTSST